MTEQASIEATPEYKYDLAVSFAGEQRDFVEAVVRGLSLPKARVFYDADYKAELWGEDLVEVFTNLYRDEARYVVMFISREYAEKEWCNTERRAALRRRMQTQGAYLLPVRLDTTQLDDVAGLLGTIGDLDGLREGVNGVVECLRAKLSLALGTPEPSPEDDDEIHFAEVAETQEDLVTLLQERPHSWRWAAFASVLVQRKAALALLLRDHSLGFAHPTGERIRDYQELYALAENTMYDVEQIGTQVNNFLQTPSFMSAFGLEDDESTADPDAIVHAATRLMDFYERYLQLAQRARGASAPAKYSNVLGSCAHLMDMPLTGMDEFIDEYTGLVKDLPRLLVEANGESIVRPIELRIHMDNDLMEALLRQLRDAAELD